VSARWLALVVLAGLIGSALYEQGVPPWLVYVVRRIVYEVGGA
jgi:hypothetical protein